MASQTIHGPVRYGVQFTQGGYTTGQWHKTRTAAEQHYRGVVFFSAKTGITDIKLIRAGIRGNEVLRENDAS